MKRLFLLFTVIFAVLTLEAFDGAEAQSQWTPPPPIGSGLGAVANWAAQQSYESAARIDAERRQREERQRQFENDLFIRGHTFEADGIKTPSVLQTNCHLHSITCLERLRGR